MTFEQSLQTLAEMFPEKFDYQTMKLTGVTLYDGDEKYHPIKTVFNFGETYVETCYNKLESKMRWTEFTQDSIDTILGEIGWGYELNCSNRTDGWWHFQAWCLGGAVSFVDTTETYLSKLEAAKAALCAVVEKLQGEKK